MELGDAKVLAAHEANSNSNNHILSDEDIKLSFAGLVENDHSDNQETHTFEEVTKENFGANQPQSQVLDKSGHAEDGEKQKWLEEVEQERLEWEALETAHKSVSGEAKNTDSLSFAEALNYFLSKEMDKSAINPTLERTGLSALLHFFFGPPRLRPTLIEERDSVFCIAKIQLEDGEQIHNRVLQTIYKKLIGSKFDCPRRGPHWQDIGFQGNDPATDLRGVGFLGLMHILYAIDNVEVYSLFMEFFRLSLHEEQNYPFCVMSFNVTRIILEMFREERLNREINKANEVIPVMNRFYVALFYHIFNIWKTQHKTMKESGHVMQDVEKTARKYPKRLLKALELALEQRKLNKVSNVSAEDSRNTAGLYARRISAVSDDSDSEKELGSKTQASEIQSFSDILHLPRKNEPVTDL